MPPPVPGEHNAAEREKLMRDGERRAAAAAARHRADPGVTGCGALLVLCFLGGRRGAHRQGDGGSPPIRRQPSPRRIANTRRAPSPVPVPQVMEAVDGLLESVPPSASTYVLRLLVHAVDPAEVWGGGTVGGGCAG